MTATARRSRRVGSDEAHAWARNLRLHNPMAKLVLSMTTLYVDGEGACFVGIPALAEDCELAPSTVRARLGWLEQIGAIARFPQWIDEHGRRNGEARGRRTSDEIRLLLDADPDAIELRAKGGTPPGDGAQSEESEPVTLPPHGGSAEATATSAPPCEERVSDSKNGSGTPLALCRPSDSAEGLNPSNPNQNIPPPTPSPGGEGDAGDQDQGSANEIEGWAEFERAFTADGEPIMRVSLGKQLFSALDAGERALVTAAARGLIQFRKGQKHPKTKPSVQVFIREREAWPGFAKHAPAKLPPRVFVAEGTHAFAALGVLAKIAGRGNTWPPRLVDDPDAEAGTTPRRGVLRYGDLHGDLLALADFAEVDDAAWTIAGEKTQQLAAWIGRLREWEGRPPEVGLISTGEYVEHEWDGKIFQAPKKIRGLRVPRPWPPRKDGTWSEGNADAEQFVTEHYSSGSSMR